MLKVSTNKAIAGYAPCPECGTLAVVHFPDGGRRANTPYLSCGGCNKTIQASTTKAHIIEHYVPTLDAYAERYGVDVSAEKEQITANKWPENPALYEAKMHGLVEADSLDSFSGQLLSESDAPQESAGSASNERATEEASEAKSVTIDNDTQQVVSKEEEVKKSRESGGGVWLVVLLALLLLASLGGYLLIRHRKRKAPNHDTQEEVKAND
ncbi:hypothetical protein [Vibrio sonorensis]|uniref:hypothetical protein n=1 Tax=Vibrio sonorensis TaxID=1004316 RepID=UPI0008DA74D6|nr:hypothetical protein [Vibrio sonorensis]